MPTSSPTAIPPSQVAAPNRIGYRKGMRITQALTLTKRQRATLSRARLDAGLSTTELAAAVGCSQPMITQIETGAKPAPPALLRRIAKRLGLEFSAKLSVELRRGK